MHAAAPISGSSASGATAAGCGGLARAVSLGLPWGLSLVVHAALLLVLGGVAWRLSAPPPVEEPSEVFTALQTAMASAPPPAATAPVRAETPPPPSVPPPTSVPAPTASGPGPSAPAATVPGRVTIETRPAPAADPAPGAFVGLDSPDAAPVAFAGLAAKRATSVVFVIDASGPMLGVLPRVLAEVRRSAAALVPAQRFGVIVFHDEETSALAPRLLDATPRNLARLDDWLATVAPSGRSTPLEGLKAALALSPRPRVVFLLSRSIARSHGGQWGAGTAAILEELDRLNPIDPETAQRATVIKALQFIEPDPTGTMQAIAGLHGGGGTSPDYRVLRPEELPR